MSLSNINSVTVSGANWKLVYSGSKGIVMYDLATFSKRVKELYRQSYPYDGGRHANQTDLAAAVGLSMADLNRRLNAAKGPQLSDANVRAIVRTLADWGAITTQAEALDLLELVCCPQFTTSEWSSPPLDSLDPLRPTLDPAPAPLPPPRNQKTNLPLPLTSFVGRSREQAAIVRLLDESRLLTLTGPGGVGKTRLALTVAAGLSGRFAHGIWLVELAGLSNPELVPQAIASVLKIKEEAGKPLLDTMLEQLERREMLLVMDNCEHLVPAVAQTVHRLLCYCEHLHVITTSRELLRTQGEVSFIVPSLRLPRAQAKLRLGRLSSYPAIRLFIERARAGRPGFQLTDSNAAAVLEICQRLDGLPLAIELAAARVRMMGVDQIREGLGNRFGLLVGGRRDESERHQSLMAMIDWSYQLLNPAEQRLFKALAIFAGGFVLEAVEAAGADPDDKGKNVSALLGQLVDKSLVVGSSGEDDRYRLLETIREYALAQFAVDREQLAVRLRHRDYYLRMTNHTYVEWMSPQHTVWIRQFEAEHDNLRVALHGVVERGETDAAMRLCAGLHWFWDRRGHQREGYTWCKAVLAMPGEADPNVRGEALFAASVMAERLGDVEACETWGEQCLAIFRSTGNEAWIALTLSWIAIFAAVYQHGPATAQRNFEESLSIARHLGDKVSMAYIFLYGSFVFEEQGNYTTARSFQEQSLAISKELGHKVGMCMALASLGRYARLDGDYTAARAHIVESLRLRRELGDRLQIWLLLEWLASIDAVQEQKVRAARLLGAIEFFRDELGTSNYAPGEEEHQLLLASLRESLGEARFAAAWAEGLAMTLEQAIAHALEKDSSS